MNALKKCWSCVRYNIIFLLVKFKKIEYLIDKLTNHALNPG